MLRNLCDKPRFNLVYLNILFLYFSFPLYLPFPHIFYYPHPKPNPNPNTFFTLLYKLPSFEKTLSLTLLTSFLYSLFNFCSPHTSIILFHLIYLYSIYSLYILSIWPLQLVLCFILFRIFSPSNLFRIHVFTSKSLRIFKLI